MISGNEKSIKYSVNSEYHITWQVQQMSTGKIEHATKLLLLTETKTSHEAIIESGQSAEQRLAQK